MTVSTLPFIPLLINKNIWGTMIAGLLALLVTVCFAFITQCEIFSQLASKMYRIEMEEQRTIDTFFQRKEPMEEVWSQTNDNMKDFADLSIQAAGAVIGGV